MQDDLDPKSTDANLPLGNEDTKTAEELTTACERLRSELAKVIVGQDEVVEQLLIALFANGHCILEGCAGPGQDADDLVAGPLPCAVLQPDSVHAGSDAVGHHGYGSDPGGSKPPALEASSS